MTHQPKPGYYGIVPAHVRYADIEPNAKLLYSEITALCNIEGYCWASNEYFADLYEVGTRVVQKWLKSLKGIGAIKIDNPSNLEQDRQRKIWPCDDAKKMFTERTKVQGGVNKCSSTPIYNNTTNENPPNPQEGETPVPSRKRKRKTEDLIKRADRVYTTPSQHTKLLQRANQDESLLNAWYEELSIWKIKKGYEGGMDFSPLTGWVPQAVENKKKNVSATLGITKETEKFKKNKEVAEKFVKNYNSHGKESETIRSIGIEGGGCLIISYKNRTSVNLEFMDEDFEKRLQSLTRKLNIKFEE